jgi:hypothetical protein
LKKKYNDAAMIRMLDSYEKEFAYDDYNGHMHDIGIKPFMHINGSTPILISAPRSVNRVQEGKVVRSDTLTGGLAKVLAKETGSHAIIKTFNDETDPICDTAAEDGDYKNEAVRIIKKHAIKMVLEITGMEEHDGFDTAYASRSNGPPHDMSFLPVCLKQMLVQSGLRPSATPCRIDDASIQHCAANTGIPCIRISLGREYRINGSKGAVSVVRSVAAFITFIHSRWNELCGSHCLIPRNRKKPSSDYFHISIHQSMAHKLGIKKNSFVNCFNDNEEFICRATVSDSVDEGQIVISNYLYRHLYRFGPPQYFMIRAFPIFDCKSGVSRLEERTPINEISVSESLYEKISPEPTSRYLLHNLRNNTYLIADSIRSRKSKSKDSFVFLTKYQRELFETKIPPVNISKDEFSRLSSMLSEDDVNAFASSYDIHDDMYVLKSKYDYDNLERVLKKTDINSLELLKLPRPAGRERKKQKLLGMIIGKRSMYLKTGHVYPQDEDENVIRISKSLMVILGIREADKVNLTYNGATVILRALSYSKDKEDAYVRSDMNRDANSIVGVPAHIRADLNIVCSNAVVMIERNTMHILKKKAYQYLLTILGSVIAVYQLNIGATLQVVMSIVLISVALWIISSSERSKVK